MGIGAAGFVDDERATVLFAPNIAWRHEPLQATRIEERVGLPVVVENDANAAAWGEYRFGAGQGHDDVVCITVGTGHRRRHHHRRPAAPRAVRRGRRVRPHTGGARRPDAAAAAARGCWEQYASGRALVRYARERAAATPENAEILLGLGDGDPETIEGRHITEAAEGRRPGGASSASASWPAGSARDWPTSPSLFDPSAFIVGGGVSDDGRPGARPDPQVLPPLAGR